MIATSSCSKAHSPYGDPAPRRLAKWRVEGGAKDAFGNRYTVTLWCWPSFQAMPIIYFVVHHLPENFRLINWVSFETEEVAQQLLCSCPKNQ